MRTLAIVVLLWAGCFVDPNGSIDVSKSTHALCDEVPATCGATIGGFWKMDRDCTLDGNYACPTYEWQLEAAAPLSLDFKSDDTVTISSVGRTRAAVTFDKACSTASGCVWTSNWACQEVGATCECTFEKNENDTVINYYTAKDGVVSFDAGQGEYMFAEYCVDGDHLFLMYNDGSYMRLKRS